MSSNPKEAGSSTRSKTSVRRKTSVGVGDVVRARYPVGSHQLRGRVDALLPPLPGRPDKIRARILWSSAKAERPGIMNIDNLDLIESSFRAQYPEHEKLTLIQENSQLLGEFLDFLSRSPYQLTVLEENVRGDLVPRPLVLTDKQIIGLLGEFFGIDITRLNDEKEKMYQEIRRQNQVREQELKRDADKV